MPFRCPGCGRLDEPIPPTFLSTMSPDAIIFANDDEPLAAHLDEILNRLGI
jgi:hypothetical protein